MVVGAFPVVKLGALFIRQISKPIAENIKRYAKGHPVFRRYICIPPAQFYNWCEVKLKMWILNMGRSVSIPVLNEAQAIELGANLLGEAVIFTIAAVALIFEVNRSSRKEAAKEAAKAEEMAKLTSSLMDLYIQTETQAAQIRELNRMILDLDSRVVQVPWKPKKELPPPDDTIPPPSNPPKISQDVPLQPEEKPSDDASECVLQKSDIKSSLLLNAVELIENDFWKDENKERENGIVTLALNHFYQEVYKVPISV